MLVPESLFRGEIQARLHGHRDIHQENRPKYLCHPFLREGENEPLSYLPFQVKKKLGFDRAFSLDGSLRYALDDHIQHLNPSQIIFQGLCVFFNQQIQLDDDAG